MIAANKVKARIIETGQTVGSVAGKIGMDPSTLYRKLRNPDRLTVSEVKKLVAALDYSEHDAQLLLNTLLSHICD